MRKDFSGFFSFPRNIPDGPGVYRSEAYRAPLRGKNQGPCEANNKIFLFAYRRNIPVGPGVYRSDDGREGAVSSCAKTEIHAETLEKGKWAGYNESSPGKSIGNPKKFFQISRDLLTTRQKCVIISTEFPRHVVCFPFRGGNGGSGNEYGGYRRLVGNHQAVQHQGSLLRRRNTHFREKGGG